MWGTGAREETLPKRPPAFKHPRLVLERVQRIRQPPAYLKEFICDCVESGNYERPAGTIQRGWQQNMRVVSTTKKLTFARAESQIRFLRRRHSVLVSIRKHVARSFLTPMQSRADMPVVINNNHSASIQYVLLYRIEG